MHGASEDDVPVPPLMKTALTWGLFMGVSSNLRYQVSPSYTQVYVLPFCKIVFEHHSRIYHVPCMHATTYATWLHIMLHACLHACGSACPMLTHLGYHKWFPA